MIVNKKGIRFKKFSASVRALTRCTKSAADFDLFSFENKTIKGFRCETINGNIGIKILKLLIKE